MDVLPLWWRKAGVKEQASHTASNVKGSVESEQKKKKKETPRHLRLALSFSHFFRFLFRSFAHRTLA